MGNPLEESNSAVYRNLIGYGDGGLEKTREEATLQSLSKMNNNRKYSDFVIVCKNGVRKYGSRLWLSARCPEFEKIFTNQISTMTRSGLAVLSLPHLGPGAMLIVLEYLYTGSPGAFLQHLEPKSIRRLAHDVINAAKELHLPRLENMFWRVLDKDVARLELACPEHEEDKERGEIFEALSRMLESPRYSDVVIQSSGGALIPASRLWLDARCPALGRMFARRRESHVGGQTFEQKVSLNISTEVVHIVLEYLYMGSPRIYMQRMDPKKRWTAGLEAICAARYLEIPLLKEFLRRLLIEDVSKSRSDPTYIELCVFRLSELRNFRFEFLPQAGRNMEPRDNSRYVNRLATELVRMIERGWTETDHVRQLSREDFIFFLKKTRRKSDSHGRDGYKLEEYHRLRSIIKWCVWEHSWSTGVPPDVAIKLVYIFFSRAEFAGPLHFDDCTDSEREESYELLYRERRRIARANTTRKILNRICKIAKFEQVFLPLVDLELIHPALLTNLLKPWGLISSSRIRQALEKQARTRRQS